MRKAMIIICHIWGRAHHCTVSIHKRQWLCINTLHTIKLQNHANNWSLSLNFVHQPVWGDLSHVLQSRRRRWSIICQLKLLSYQWIIPFEVHNHCYNVTHFKCFTDCFFEWDSLHRLLSCKENRANLRDYITRFMGPHWQTSKRTSLARQLNRLNEWGGAE